jgi:hypothetical protein
MRLKFLTAAVITTALTVLSMPVAYAEIRVDGMFMKKNFLGHLEKPSDEFQIVHGSEFKGAHKVAISVFDVAFPHENHFTATSRGSNSMFSKASNSGMKTTLTGIDQATQQRITDKAYATFVAQLTAAGYEVVDQATLANAAPEFATWEKLPNFTEGRFGTYVVPTGQSLRLLPGDTASRDTSGMFGEQLAGFRHLEKSQAFSRSPYIAHDAKMGIIAVTLVVDYGVYSSSGRQNGMGNASAGFRPGATIEAGNAVDRGSLIQYWGTSSGGFPAYAFLQWPVRSDKELGTLQGDADSGDYTLAANPAKFEAAADEVAAIGVQKLVGVMAAAK